MLVFSDIFDATGSKYETFLEFLTCWLCSGNHELLEWNKIMTDKNFCCSFEGGVPVLKHPVPTVCRCCHEGDRPKERH